MPNQNGWIGVDLDGTLAHLGEWKGVDHIGEPIPAMMDRVRGWLAEGIEVRIFTARVGALYLASASIESKEEALCAQEFIIRWTEKHFGQRLRVTAVKDYGMRMLYDDRCTQVETNTGRLIAGEQQGGRNNGTVPKVW